jgi:tRNA(His) 5'-end guanylyltransferase
MKIKKDSLGDRIKYYESFCTNTKLYHTIPIIVRLDGVAFHTFTKGLNRPFDERLSHCMLETTKFLCKEVNATIGYTQSDEITLVLGTQNFDSKIYFDAKLFKLTSVLASKATVKFNELIRQNLPEKASKNPVFDCRIFNVPSEEEAINCLIWRQNDAKRNAISMAAQAKFSHKELHGKSSKQMLEMLETNNVDFKKYPGFFKNGVFIKKKTLTFLKECFIKINPDNLVVSNNSLTSIKDYRWYIEEINSKKSIIRYSDGSINLSSVAATYLKSEQEAEDLKNFISNVCIKFSLEDSPESFTRNNWENVFEDLELSNLENRVDFVYRNADPIFKK